MSARSPQPNRGTTTRKEVIVALLRRKNGATIGELAKSTGWQSHSLTGFLSGVLKKQLGLELTTERREGADRRYWLKGRA